MENRDLGRTRIAVLIALVIVTVGLVAASGFVFAEDQRSGEEILNDVQERYDSADSVSVDTTVTAEAGGNTTQFGAAVATAGDEQARLNLSTDEGYVLTGTDGQSLWVHDPKTELTAVVTEEADNEATVALFAGTEEPTGLALSEVLPGDIDEDTTVSELLDEFENDEIPPELQSQLEELPQDATLAELRDGDEIAEQFEDVSAEDLNVSGEDLNLPDDVEADEFEDIDEIEFEEFNETALGETVDESDLENLEAVELPDNWEELTLAEKWEQTELPEEWADSEWAAEIDAFTEEYETVEEFEQAYDSDRVSVELVGTTTVDGQEAYELLITHPEVEGESRLWTAVDSDVVLKQETTGPHGTVTVDVVETRFDVSPADATFQPPGQTELASATVTWTDDADEFASQVPLTVAEPVDGWTFERGGTLTADVSIPTEEGVEGDAAAVAATYVDGEQSVVVAQSDRTYDVSEYADTETIRGQEVALEVTDEGAVATWSEAGTTVTVAGDLSETELRSLVVGIEFEG